MIQNLENFVSMAIQGTQVPMYTYTLFLYFQFLFLFLYEKQDKPKLKRKQTKTNLKKTKQYIKLDWLKIIKQNTQVMKTKTRRGDRKSDRITWSPFLSIPWKNLFI